MKKVFKKFFFFSFLFSFIFILTACGGKKTTTTGDVEITTGDAETTTDDVITEPEETYDLHGAQVRILHGAPYEVDPFLDDFGGTHKSEKQALELAVEEKYNVDIVYELYPDNAGWGPDRITAIVNGVIAGDPIGHIYALDSRWVGQLAEAEALANLSQYDDEVTHGFFHDTTREFGTYKGNLYGISNGVITATTGLYFNLDLLDTIGKESPAVLWNDGEWTWSDFTTYVNDVQAALSGLGDGYFALGGVPSVWAQHMVPANGSYLVNPDTKKVTLTQTSSLNAFQYLNNLRTSGVWEPVPEYDAGSADFKLGKVLIHPGDLWFLNASNRWGNLSFDLGYVPYPIGDGVDFEDYKIGVSGIGFWGISAGFEKEKNPNGLNDEMLYKIWTDLQYWEDPQNAFDSFETVLETRYNDFDSIDAHMSVANKVYFEQLFNLGISGYNADYGFYIVSNRAINEGNVRSEFEAILPVYQEKLDEIFGN